MVSLIVSTETLVLVLTAIASIRSLFQYVRMANFAGLLSPRFFWLSAIVLELTIALTAAFITFGLHSFANRLAIEAGATDQILEMMSSLEWLIYALLIGAAASAVASWAACQSLTESPKNIISCSNLPFIENRMSRFSCG